MVVEIEMVWTSNEEGCGVWDFDIASIVDQVRSRLEWRQAVEKGMC